MAKHKRKSFRFIGTARESQIPSAANGSHNPSSAGLTGVISEIAWFQQLLPYCPSLGNNTARQEEERTFSNRERSGVALLLTNHVGVDCSVPTPIRRSRLSNRG